jgi:hypothetical protein
MTALDIQSMLALLSHGKHPGHLRRNLASPDRIVLPCRPGSTPLPLSAAGVVQIQVEVVGWAVASRKVNYYACPYAYPVVDSLARHSSIGY